MILLNFEESMFNDSQKVAYDKLKVAATNGLGKVLIEILSKRQIFEERFKAAFSENVNELKESYKNIFPERALNHIALLVSPAKILWNDLAFPFDFKGVLLAIIENAENQNSLLKKSGAISIFWESFSNSLKKGLIVCFDGNNSKTAQFNIKETDNNAGIIQIKLPNLYPIYVRYCRDNNIQFIDQNSLKMLLTSKSNKEFLNNSQKGRGSAYTDKNFGSCYQFTYTKIDDSIYISNIEINM
jgi:hypothetical protein